MPSTRSRSSTPPTRAFGRTAGRCPSHGSKRMYLGVSSESYGPLLDDGRLKLDEWFRLCADELGVGAVELEDRHVGAPTPARLDEVRAAADRHRLEIVNIALMNNFGLADPAARRAEEARTIEWLEASRR